MKTCASQARDRDVSFVGQSRFDCAVRIPNTDDRRPTTDDRRPTTDDRRPKIEDSVGQPGGPIWTGFTWKRKSLANEETAFRPRSHDSPERPRIVHLSLVDIFLECNRVENMDDDDTNVPGRMMVE